MTKDNNSINYGLRWQPDFRYRSDKKVSVSLANFDSTEPSVTDKEAYRVTLASLRGELAQGSGRPDVGSYSLKAGEPYHPNNDFSYLNRKDITIVELDEFIAEKTRQLKEYDGELSEQIKSELAKAQSKKQSLEKSSDDKNNSVKED